MSGATAFRGRLADYAQRAAQSLAVWAVLVGLLAAVWPAALRMPHLWMLLGITLLANVLQPSYRPFSGSETPEDRGTAAQILWTVALAQLAALGECLVRKPALTLDAISWGAFAVMAAGLALRTWAVFTLGRYFTWNVEVQEGQRLVRDGPYRLVRHPSYTGALLTFLLVPVFLHSWLAAVAAAAALPAAFARRIRHEERVMRAVFPDYAEYAARTGALFPRLS